MMASPNLRSCSPTQSLKLNVGDWISAGWNRDWIGVIGRGLLILALVLISLGGVSCTCSNKHASVAAKALVNSAREDLRPLSSVEAGELTDPQLSYLSYYGFKTDRSRHKLGTFDSRGEPLAAHLIRAPLSGRGTVIVVHGYFDHSGCLPHLVNGLVDRGYNVAIYDHPGHGLSHGRRISTKDFSIYRSGLSDFTAEVKKNFPPPYDVVAHSMGATTVIDHLLATEAQPFRRMILVTPLIQDATPRALVNMGYAVSPIADYLPRISENNSSDPDYISQFKADPLQFRCVSIKWTKSFQQWRRRTENTPPRAETPLVLNAELDTVINIDYGQWWMRKTFPKGQFVNMSGGRHHLLNEAQPLRGGVLDLIMDELGR